MSGEIKLNTPGGGSVTLVAEDRADDTTFLLSGDGVQGMESGVTNEIYWIKFPDGTLIQHGMVQLLYQNPNSNVYGTTSGAINDANAQLFMPIPFIDLNYHVTISPRTGKVHGARAVTRDTGSFFIWGYYVTGQNPQFDWIAIGRWK